MKYLTNKQVLNLIDEAQNIINGWNGKDDKFLVDGYVYTEDDAHWADDIVGKCNELIELLKRGEK